LTGIASSVDSVAATSAASLVVGAREHLEMYVEDRVVMSFAMLF
jgi:hypothetical protein